MQSLNRSKKKFEKRLNLTRAAIDMVYNDGRNSSRRTGAALYCTPYFYREHIIRQNVIVTKEFNRLTPEK
jgi:hypothetical protein